MRFSGVKRPLRCVAALLAGLVAGSGNLHAQTAKPTEYQVKAAYLVNFVKFIEWPRASGPADDPFAICVLGQDPFGPALEAALAGETVGRHALVPRRVTSAREAANCRVVFIGEDDRDASRSVSALDNAGVLTVSDVPEFLKHGGIIQFVLQGNRVRFEVNLTAARKAGLNLSSELLKVAAAVRRYQ
jgi:hypothetical protein